MGKVYKEIIVPAPKECEIHPCNNRVNAITKTPESGRHRLCVGWLCKPEDVPQELVDRCEKGTNFMHPNAAYFDKFGSQYLEFNPHDHEKVKKHQLIVGLYALVLAIVIKIGLYRIMLKHYDIDIVNGILDFAMYSIIYKTDKQNTFNEMMQNHVVFAGEPFSESRYSDLFKNRMNQSINQNILDEWLDYNIENHYVEEAVLSVDGTNVNCESESNELAAYGHAKSNKHIKIITMLWAIIADGPHKGRPLTYTADKGSVPDNKEMDKMLEIWKIHKIKMKMSIFDRGFPSDSMLSKFVKEDIPFLVMLKESNQGFKTMHEKYGELLPRDFNYMLSDGKTAGITEQNVAPYKTSNAEFCVGLFYDVNNGAARMSYTAQKLQKAKQDLQKRFDKQGPNDNPIAVPKWFDVSEENGRKIVTINCKKVNEIYKRKGFYAQASNVKMTAQEMNDCYNLRDCSEKQFSILKSQLGFRIGGVSGEDSWENLFFDGFIATIIRNEIMLACKEEKIDTNQLIAELSNVVYKRTQDYYFFSQNLPKKVEAVFKHFGVGMEQLEALAPYVNSRYQPLDESKHIQPARKKGKGTLTEVRTMQGIAEEIPSTNSGETPENENTSTNTTGSLSSGEPKDTKSLAIPGDNKPEAGTPSTPKKRGGRKPGSKNKSTLEKERLEREARIAQGLPADVLPEKRGPGRPKGRKNNKTLEREKAEQEKRIAAGLPPEEPPAPKRGRGRPRGSGKKALEAEASASADSSEPVYDPEDFDDEDEDVPANPKPHKGRTRGTKNKKTLEREAEEARLKAEGLLPEPVKKSRGGRPKGARNKSTLQREEQDRELANLTGIDILGEKSGTPTSRRVRARLRREAEEASALHQGSTSEA